MRSAVRDDSGVGVGDVVGEVVAGDPPPGAGEVEETVPGDCAAHPHRVTSSAARTAIRARREDMRPLYRRTRRSFRGRASRDGSSGRDRSSRSGKRSPTKKDMAEASVWLSNPEPESKRLLDRVKLRR